MAKLETISIPISIDLKPARAAVKRARTELDTANRELATIEAALNAAQYGIKTEVTK